MAAIFVPLERLFAAHPQKVLRKGIGVDLGYYFLNSLVIAFLLSVPIGLVAWAAPPVPPGGLPGGDRLDAALGPRSWPGWWPGRSAITGGTA